MAVSSGKMSADGRDSASVSGISRHEKGSKLPNALRDAAIAAFLVGVLGFFFIGLRTDIAPGGLDIKMRWGAWIISIAVVFAGLLALNLFVFDVERPEHRRWVQGSAASHRRFLTSANGCCRSEERRVG